MTFLEYEIQLKKTTTLIILVPNRKLKKKFNLFKPCFIYRFLIVSKNGRFRGLVTDKIVCAYLGGDFGT